MTDGSTSTLLIPTFRHERSSVVRREQVNGRTTMLPLPEAVCIRNFSAPGLLKSALGYVTPCTAISYVFQHENM
jgi:hypothetical protein